MKQTIVRQSSLNVTAMRHNLRKVKKERRGRLEKLQIEKKSFSPNFSKEQLKILDHISKREHSSFMNNFPSTN